MLIQSHRHTEADLKHWREHCERLDASFGRYMTDGCSQIRTARRAVERFLDDGPAHIGVSWGKDSVAALHLVTQLMGIDVPVVWMRWDPLMNPDCELVRDAYLDAFPGTDYTEIRAECALIGGEWVAKMRHPFDPIREHFGERRITGVRGQESAARSRRALHGENFGISCAPLVQWSDMHVFGYLHRHRLPVHPAYAMTLGGRLDRRLLRVGTIGGSRGDGVGRAEWEAAYYHDAPRYRAESTLTVS